MRSGRAARYGIDFKEYIETADEEITVITQNGETVKNSEDKLSVEGVDAFITGPANLSTSLGTPLQFNHQKFADVINRILEAENAGVPAGFASSAEAAKKYKDMRFQLINIGLDIEFMVASCKAVRHYSWRLTQGTNVFPINPNSIYSFQREVYASFLYKLILTGPAQLS